MCHRFGVLKGFGAGLAWRGFETWRQVSWRNRVLVTIDFFRSKVSCLAPSVLGPQLRSAALRADALSCRSLDVMWSLVMQSCRVTLSDALLLYIMYS